MVSAGIISRPYRPNHRRARRKGNGACSCRWSGRARRRRGAARARLQRRAEQRRWPEQCPGCSRSPLCGRRGGTPRQSLQRVQWKQTLGYTFEYPYVLPPGFGGVPAVALDSKDNLWVFQRADMGKPQLFKFDPNYKLILEIGPDVIGVSEQGARHGGRRRGQRLDHSRGQRDRHEDQSRRKAAAHVSANAAAAETGTKRKGSGSCGSR